MNKNIGKFIIFIIIVIGVSFAWILKNNERKELTNDVITNNTVNEDIKDVINEIIVEDKEKVDENKVNQESKYNENIEVKQDKTETEKIEEVIENSEEKNIEIDKNDANFELSVNSLNLEELKSYGLPILIDFGSDSCIPCKMMAPVLKELNAELRGKAIIKFVDVWEYPEASEGFEFSLIPTQFFIDKNGEIYSSHTGAITKEEALKILREMGLEE